MLFFLLINVKMPTIVGILTFMSRKNLILNWVEHEKSFITSGPGLVYRTVSQLLLLSNPQRSVIWTTCFAYTASKHRLIHLSKAMPTLSHFILEISDGV